ncbi:MAG: hypothetical protein ACRCX8_20145 [Sarcina sp.]
MQIEIKKEIDESRTYFICGYDEESFCFVRVFSVIGKEYPLDVVALKENVKLSLDEVKSRLSSKHNDAIEEFHESFHQLIDEIYLYVYKILDLHYIYFDALEGDKC